MALICQTDGWVAINMPIAFNPGEIIEWISYNTKGDYKIGIYYAFFERNDDAVFFKLKWCYKKESSNEILRIRKYVP